MTSQKQNVCLIFFQFVVIISVGLFSTGIGLAQTADVKAGLSECAAIVDPEKRLTCFDRLSGRVVPQEAAESQKPKEAAWQIPPQLTVMEKDWDLNVQKRHHSFVLRPYRTNYFLPVAYNSSPNQDYTDQNDGRANAQNLEAKFQVSFKAKVFEDLLQKPFQGFYDDLKVIKGMDVWVGYTQLSFWQLYNSAFSSPFRDTNYEPEILLNFRSQWVIPGLRGTKLQFFNAGLSHQSNGRSEPLSRSWNRVVGNVGLEKDNFNILLKAWYRFPESASSDDNPDVNHYMGNGELWLTYFHDKQRFALMLRNNLSSDNVGAVQLDWIIPPVTLGKILLGRVVSNETLEKYLTDKFGLYFQYFNGYGECLLDYNKSANRFSVGIMIAEWN